MLTYSLILWAWLATQTSAACSRETLQGATAAYIQAQVQGDPGQLNLASDANYAENDVPMDIATGVLSEPITVDFNRSIFDTTQCAAFTELAAAASAHPYVIHTRMVLGPGADDGIATLESRVTDAGDWVFNATAFLQYAAREAWEPVPADARDAREQIQAAADAYLDQWADTELAVPLGTPCARLEGGLYTAAAQGSQAANTCAMPAFPQPLNVTGRRYVIDEELGAVDVFNDFPWLEASKPDGSTPSSNLIRVEEGLIRYIHEVTVCATDGCGR
ncbi:hypothetical protein F4780DRAFT_773501 [Xylariomycetidae sp. FL0641]|nr:hypothetical protein F4780DRAFT_773501 [Xylariomycetidae sp. FL0641]